LGPPTGQFPVIDVKGISKYKPILSKSEALAICTSSKGLSFYCCIRSITAAPALVVVLVVVFTLAILTSSAKVKARLISDPAGLNLLLFGHHGD